MNEVYSKVFTCLFVHIMICRVPLMPTAWSSLSFMPPGIYQFSYSYYTDIKQNKLAPGYFFCSQEILVLKQTWKKRKK